MFLPLSVLDLSPISSGSSGAQALRDTVNLARLTDELGYRRYWLAEHHNIPSVASSAPEVMISHVAAATERMRVGSGGIMLPNHAPLHVAETFRALESLHPGRIDLGVGRAPGSDTLTALAMRGSKDRLGADDFPDQLNDLFAFGSDQFPENHRFRGVRALPTEVNLPPVWLLGSSDYGATLAGKLGLGYAFAHHFSPDWVYAAARAYHENFRPSRWLEEPNLILTVSAACAETDAEAKRLAATLKLVGLRRSRGQFSPLPSPEEALAYPYAEWEVQQAERFLAGHFVGTPDAVRSRLQELATETGASELMVSTMTHSHAERRRSYELLANAFGLPNG